MDTEMEVRLETAKNLRRKGLRADFWPLDFKERSRHNFFYVQ